MSKKRFIDSHFWSDTWVDKLGKDEKFFFLYLLTNDKTSIAGVYEIPLKMIAFESGFTQLEVVALFKKLEAKVHYVDGWVVMKNAIKNQNYKNTKIERGIEIILQSCPQQLLEFVNIPKDFKKIDLSHVKKDKQQRLFDGSSMSHHVSSHSDTEFELDSNSNSDAKTAKDSNKFEPAAQTPAQKKAYAIAMEKEREQDERKRKAFDRKPSKPGSLSMEEIEAAYARRSMKR